ncbi:helix-turn-helix transcriptional regulator [Chitinophaga agrisoli]|uniref:Helix-turn-helix transcriptional regulator n=1 Tax=Chitinophaga agrisoli TaxID=2607653 RepID=A0A5B2VJE2_9BACT|nr:AraC family transcriptional regulator [Chitinophaga agrisoli]KAA2239065.1 helix-turn-helix transcriptional regulator [Chitinophaga agrisoli]
MRSTQTMQHFRESEANSLRDKFSTEDGHFNLFRNKGYTGPMELAYQRRDFYSISLVDGPINIDYGDQSVTVNKNALFITSPREPFGWQLLERLPNGFACIFSNVFLDKCNHVRDYTIFQPGNYPIFSLSNCQMAEISLLFEKIATELQGNFIYKYDAILNLVLQIFFKALKLSPVIQCQGSYPDKPSLVVSSFIKLLDGQFMAGMPSPETLIRCPATFAQRLAISVNYLNRKIKEATGKTTSQLITERLIREAKGLLKHSDRSIKEISCALGFDDVAHFIHSFKKMEGITPRSYRKHALI